MINRLIFLGTPEFAAPHLKALHELPDTEIVAVFSQPPRPVGRKKIIEKSAVHKMAEELKLPVFTPEKFSTQETEKQLKELKTDLVVVSAFGEIISEDILYIPRLGFINIHASLLPKNRGASPIQSAILDGDKKTGVTTQQVVYKMDAGPILAKEELEISKQDTTESLTKKLSQLGTKMIVDKVPLILSKEMKAEEQDETNATYCKKIRKEDGVTDPKTETAEEIERKVRAFIPWPTVSLELNGKKIQILESKLITEEKTGNPGSIIETEDKYPAVCCKKGSLVLIKVKPEGKKEMSGKDFLMGYRD